MGDWRPLGLHSWMMMPRYVPASTVRGTMVSEMASQSLLPELVRDAKLQATIENKRTTHTRRSGHRAISSESWEFEKILGHGGNGIVLLERKVKDDDGPAELRAVKGIQISHGQSKSAIMKYIRELEAFAKFSQKRVWPLHASPVFVCVLDG